MPQGQGNPSPPSSSNYTLKTAILMLMPSLVMPNILVFGVSSSALKSSNSPAIQTIGMIPHSPMNCLPAIPHRTNRPHVRISPSCHYRALTQHTKLMVTSAASRCLATLLPKLHPRPSPFTTLSSKLLMTSSWLSKRHFADMANAFPFAWSFANPTQTPFGITSPAKVVSGAPLFQWPSAEDSKCRSSIPMAGL